MSEKFTSLIAAIATTLTIFVATAPAGAQERPITVIATEERVPVRYVSYRDLNLARAEDETDPRRPGASTPRATSAASRCRTDRPTSAST